MTSLNRNARIAGLLYVTLLTAPLRLLYTPSKLFVAENASATANNVAAHETLFRLGILSDLFTATMAIFLTLAFNFANFNIDPLTRPSTALRGKPQTVNGASTSTRDLNRFRATQGPSLFGCASFTPKGVSKREDFAPI
jgi:hypothetical protein